MKRYIVVDVYTLHKNENTDVRDQWFLLGRDEWGRDKDQDLAIYTRFNFLNY